MENVEFASITVKEDTWIGKAMQQPESLGPTWPDTIQIWWGIGLWLLCVKIITYGLTFVCGSCVYTSVWVRGKEAVLSSNYQASRWDEDAMSDVAPACHAPVGLNKRYIRLKPIVPEGSDWQREPQISAVVTEADWPGFQIISDSIQPKVLGGNSDENTILTCPGFEVAKAPWKIIGDKSSYWNMNDRLTPC